MKKDSQGKNGYSFIEEMSREALLECTQPQDIKDMYLELKKISMDREAPTKERISAIKLVFDNVVAKPTIKFDGKVKDVTELDLSKLTDEQLQNLGAIIESISNREGSSN